MLRGAPAAAEAPASQLFIESLNVAGGKLVFTATFPPGVTQAALEMRQELTTSWRPVATLAVPVTGGTTEFFIPLPALPRAFYRLNAILNPTAPAQLSAELQYLTMPSLCEVSSNGTSSTEAVFHFKGLIDGSDRIVITHEGAWWQHVHWGWPDSAVTVNGVPWNPSEKNYLTTTGAVAFLPKTYSLAAVNLEVIQGRDIVALERTNEALIVYLDDTPVGAAPYEFNIHFRPKIAEPLLASPSLSATLKIAARIDGSDLLKITAHEATWTHMAYGDPVAVSLNSSPWDMQQTNVIINAGTNQYLPAGVDFLTARIVNRQGRDLATMWADHDAVWVSFADNPNGDDPYELELLFGQ